MAKWSRRVLKEFKFESKWIDYFMDRIRFEKIDVYFNNDFLSKEKGIRGEIAYNNGCTLCDSYETRILRDFPGIPELKIYILDFWYHFEHAHFKGDTE